MLEFFRTTLGRDLLRHIASISKSLAIIAKELQKMNKTSTED